METKKGDKIYVLGTGGQAPYGIGEIIDIIPASHINRVREAIAQYHNAPTLRLNGKDGVRVELNWEGRDVVGYRRLDY